jgi:hypothetical protein
MGIQGTCDLAKEGGLSPLFRRSLRGIFPSKTLAHKTDSTNNFLFINNMLK